ncbi:rCG28884 [Rattus norvegicus]|uniref:RCG28884 n=1 Tax=Rattus norvegicus TaxID=10116 RepID=A6HW12_RAT|nr:rCG28884 [Rattus norvegicus]
MEGLICKNLMLYQTYIRFRVRTLKPLLIFNECSNE